MKQKIKGIMAAVLTPFNSDESVNYKVLKNEIDYTIEDCNANAIVAAGVETQEYQVLSMEGRKELISNTIKFVDGRKPVVAGVSHASINTTKQLIDFVQDEGGDVVQVIATPKPWGSKPTKQETINYFEELNSYSNLPILVYNNPRLGLDLSPNVMIELSQLDNIQYFKETSRDMAKVSRLIKEIDVADHSGYFTTIEMLLISLQLGGSGAMMPPPAVKIATQIVDSFKKGDFEKAIALQKHFCLYPALWLDKGLLPVMKASMKIIGLNVGDPVPPFQSLDQEQEKQLRNYFKEIGLI